LVLKVIGLDHGLETSLMIDVK